MTEPSFVYSSHAVVVKKEKETAEPFLSYAESQIKDKNIQNDANIENVTLTDVLNVRYANKTEFEENEVRRKIKNNKVIVCKQEDIEAIVNIKKEIEDHEYGFGENVKYDITETLCTNEITKDKEFSSEIIRGGIDVIVKQEVENAAYNLQMELERMDGSSESSNKFVQLIPEEGHIESNVLSVSYGDNEVTNIQYSSSVKGNQQIPEEKNIQSNLPTTSNGENEGYNIQCGISDKGNQPKQEEGVIQTDMQTTSYWDNEDTNIHHEFSDKGNQPIPEERVIQSVMPVPHYEDNEVTKIQHRFSDKGYQPIPENGVVQSDVPIIIDGENVVTNIKNKSSGKGNQPIAEEGVIQSDVPIVTNGENEVPTILCRSSEKGNVRLSEFNQVQLEPEILFTIVSNFPDFQNGIIDDDITDIDVTRLDKKDLELNQSEQMLLTGVYLKTLSNTESVASPHQRVFKICCRAEEKESGRALLISKFCTVKPNIVRPVQGGKSFCYSKNVKDSSLFVVGKNLKNRKQTENNGCKNYSVPEKKSLKNDIKNDKYLMNSINPLNLPENYGELKSKLNDTSRHFGRKMHLTNTGELRHNGIAHTGINKNGKCLSIAEQCKALAKSVTKFSKKELRNLKYDCHCGKSFDSREDRLKHVKEDHWMPKEFTCEDCRQSFRKWRDYSRHKCDDSKDENSFACTTCDRIFESKKVLQNHTDIGKKTCKLCDKVFCYLEDLSSHEKTHLKYSCKVCSKKFYTKWNLSMHLRSEHTSLKCDICKKSFLFSKFLKNHIKNMHANDLFNCCDCDKKFTNKSSYKLHKTKFCQKLLPGKTVEKITSNKLKTNLDGIPLNSIDIMVNASSEDSKDNVKEEVIEKGDTLIRASEELSNEISSIYQNSEVESQGICKDKKDMSMVGDVCKALVTNRDNTFKAVKQNPYSPETEFPFATDSCAVMPEATESLLKVSDLIGKESGIGNETRSDKLADQYIVCENDTGDENVEVESNKKDVTKEATSHPYVRVKQENKHYEDNDKVLALSNIENRNLHLSESSRAAETICYNENKLIISNSLFENKDKPYRIKRWKRKKGPELQNAKKYLTTRIESITSSLKLYRKDKVFSEQKLSGMNCEQQNTLKASQSLANNIDDSIEAIRRGSNKKHAFGKSNAMKTSIKHSDEDTTCAINDEKVIKNDKEMNIDVSGDSGEVIDRACQKHSLNDTPFKKRAAEIERNERDNGLSSEEDDRGFVEEVVSHRDVKDYSFKKLQKFSKQDEVLNKFPILKNEGQIMDKRITKHATNTEIQYDNARKKRLKADEDLSGIKLKRVSVVLTDIFKMGKANLELNNNKNEQHVHEEEEMAVDDGNKKDDKLKGTAFSNLKVYDEKLAVDAFSDVASGSESASDDDSEGYEECTAEEVAAMYKCTKTQNSK
jgi:hypothetical protein